MTEPVDAFRPRGARRPEEDALFQAGRRRRWLRQELLVRATVSVLILAFNQLVGFGGSGGPDPEVRTAALLALGLNGPYYLAARFGQWAWAQASGRMLGDVALLSLALYGAGGLAAAPYIALYTIVPVYAGAVLSSMACLIATWSATAAYLAMVLAQTAGWLPMTGPLPRNAWSITIFNLLVLNGVGVLTAVLAHAYRKNRVRLAFLYQELEQAYDESSRLNTELQRRARLQVLGEVMTGIAHEIRNALQSALLPIDLVRRKVATAVPDALRHLDQIEHGCTNAIGIVRNVLHTARQSSHEQVPLSLAEMARRTLELKGYSLRRDGIAVSLDFPPDYPAIVGPPFRLQQVLLNLLNNAQDALRNGTRTRSIAIAGRAEFDRAVVEIRDTGPGIPPEILPHLFEPFHTTKAQGTGLGLAVSAEIVRQLGGDLTASNGPDGGAVFRISLPTARLGPGPGPAEEPDDSPPDGRAAREA